MKILVVDFWSDGNLGDAVMQKEIIEQCGKVSKDVHILSCFGKNQFQLNAFNESLNYDYLTWHPSYFSTYIKLDFYSEWAFGSRTTRLMKTLVGLLVAELKLKLFGLFKLKFLLGKHRFLMLANYDAVVFNGRNYRDFGGKLKNYINNRPLTLHQELIFKTMQCVPIINAGFSAWNLDSSVSKFIDGNWSRIDAHIARESFTYSYLMNEKSELSKKLNIYQKKDLSFDYLSEKVNREERKENIIAFSITRIGEIEPYLNMLNEVLSHFITLGYRAVYVEQVYLPHENVDDLLPKIYVPFTECRSKKIDTILKCYSQCAYVLSSRMHGSIMALSQGCHVASLAYDNGAKWSILTDELIDYPIWSPAIVSKQEIVNYFEAQKIESHTNQFIEMLMRTNEKYVEKFLHNINS